ncbi:hypothetical protein [Selenomonas ruminantium]|uniref:hypothetical protein n=1 Tax=Selenomonas ruminantium TaxID=971 RepID=UPI0026F22FD4|nr:hypothetical protein [Selenomonas ruminantium]
MDAIPEDVPLGPVVITLQADSDHSIPILTEEALEETKDAFNDHRIVYLQCTDLSIEHGLVVAVSPGDDAITYVDDTGNKNSIRIK